MKTIDSNKRLIVNAANRSLVGLILLLSLIPAATAQQRTARPMSPRPRVVDHRTPLERELDSLSTRLKLTDAQKPKVKSILEKKDEQIKRLNEDASLQRPDNRYKKYKKLAEIHDKSRGKIRKLLTEEQRTKFEKIDLNT